MSARRLYRESAGRRNFKAFTVTVKETDLWIAVPRDGFTETLPAGIEELVWRTRRELESYISADPEFARTREPYLVPGNAPKIVLNMVRAGNAAGVGPVPRWPERWRKLSGGVCSAIGTRLLSKTAAIFSGALSNR